MVGTGDASDLGYVVISEHLRLSLVQPQIPHLIEIVQLLDGLLYLSLGIGQYKHVISKGQQVAPVDHIP